MNLSLSRDDPRNTTLVLPDGQIMYQVETPARLIGIRTTTIRRADANHSEVGQIEWHLFSDTVLRVGRRIIQPRRTGTVSSSQTFKAADGLTYRWKIRSGYPELAAEEHSNIVIATFHKAKRGFFSTPRPASLDISPLGIDIVDDIVTTFLWFEHKRREDQTSADVASALQGGG